MENHDTAPPSATSAAEAQAVDAVEKGVHRSRIERLKDAMEFGSFSRCGSGVRPTAAESVAATTRAAEATKKALEVLRPPSCSS
jgi:hypothetical protein